MTHTKNNQSGFSLIELLVVVLIIGILAAIMIPRFLGQRDAANNTQAKSALRNAASAAEVFYHNQGEGYPANTDTANMVAFANYLCSNEPALSIAASTSTCNSISGLTDPSGSSEAPGSNANPTKIFLTTGPTSGRTNTATLCAASKGNKAFCIMLQGTSGIQYGQGSTVGNAYTNAITGTGSNWNG